MSLQAARLVEDDAFANRGIGFNETTAAAEIHELNEHHRRSSVDVKGKGRRYDDEEDGNDSSGDDMAWDPINSNQVHLHSMQRASEDASYDYPLGVHKNASIEHHRSPPTSTMHARKPRQRTASMSSVDSRTRKSLWWRRAFVNCLFILAWYCCSTLISVYNKWMFSTDHYNFPYPLFVTSVHMFVQWSLSFLTLTVFKDLRPKNRPAARDFGTKVVPCGMATGLDIGLSNLSLRTITLSFYTMCKSSSLAFVLLFAFLFKLETPSWRLAGIIAIITAGVVLMVSTETQFVFSGMVEVLTASALGGLRWSLTQILLDKENMGMGNPIATLFWLAPVMGITLATCSLVWDGWYTVFANKDFFGSLGQSLWTIVTILVPGVIAFLMNVTEFGLIQRTSVVTLSVAGIFKEVATIFLSMFIFHDQLTPINVSGLVVTIFGIALYNYLKYDQFTSGQGGHGGHASKPKAPEGFSHVTDDSHGEEEHDRMLRRNQGRDRQFLDEEGGTAAPLYSIGDDFSLSSSPRSSVEVEPANNPFDESAQHNLHRTTHFGREQQQEQAKVEGLEEKLHADRSLLELKEREREVEESLDRGLKEHREADDWDLLGGDEFETNHDKKVA